MLLWPRFRFAQLGFIVGVACAATTPAVQAAGFSATDAVAEALPTVQATYRSIHEHPELGLKESATHDLLQGQLAALGLTQFEPVAKLPTAIITVWDSGRPGPTIALRAELDARPTQEAADHDPRSLIDGVMHNCGHDAHAAMVLGAARVITRHPAAFNGKVVFIFQPAEEIAGGADDIVADGVLQRLGVQAIFAQHVSPGMPVGAISFTSGAVLAGSNYFTITLHGQGSHAAMPSDGSDLPLVTAKVVEALASLPARRLDLLNQPVVLSVTRIETGSAKASNVLPAAATIGGTIRAFADLDAAGPSGSPSVRDLINQTLAGLTAAYGATFELSLRKGSPPTRNDLALEAALLPPVNRALPDTLRVTADRGMFSEDFSYYTAEFPCLYFGLGVTRDGRGDAGVHTADFNLHPDALAVGTRWLVELARTAGATLPAR